MKNNPTDKLRKIAESMKYKIEELSRCSEQRPTARRMRQEDARLQKRDDLRTAQSILYKLADYWQSPTGYIKPVLVGIKTKKDAEILAIAMRYEDCGRIFSNYQADFEKMGITSSEQLAAAKELLATTGPKVDDTANKIRQLEYKIMGNKSTEFFPTPQPIVTKMFSRLVEAGIYEGKILEPSAGNGRIADEAKNSGYEVDCVEVNPTLREILELKGHNLVGWDFSDFDIPEEVASGYDAVLMNPPFSEEVDHIQWAFELLKPGGVLVAVASPKLKFHTSKKYREFAAFVEQYGSYEDLPVNSFAKELNSTSVATVLITLTK